MSLRHLALLLGALWLGAGCASGRNVSPTPNEYYTWTDSRDTTTNAPDNAETEKAAGDPYSGMTVSTP